MSFFIKEENLSEEELNDIISKHKKSKK